MRTSYHNHTRWSDGRCSISDHIEEAKRLGLDEVGISDHYTIHPKELVEWSMPLDHFEEYAAEVRNAAANADGIIVRLGVEADFFPETTDALTKILNSVPLDYVIGSVHYVDDFPIDEHARFYDLLTPSELSKLWDRYWVRIAQMAATGLYDFVGHIDLPKKFGFRPEVILTDALGDALDAVKKSGMAIEINTAGWSLPAKEGYPSLEILSEARRLGIPLLINADAHTHKHLTRDFDLADMLAEDAGYTERVRFESRRQIAYPITQ